MKHILYLILAITISASLKAQSIKGKVISNSRNAVEAATISILNTEKTTIADKQGNFSFTNIAIGTYQLSISSIGFATQLKNVKIQANKTTEVSISLIEQGSQLGEVVVTADKIESDLQKTPVAITSLNAKKIEEYRIWSVSDLTALAPSAFTVEHGNSTSATFLNIRGAMGFTNEQAVATYVDGVYQFEFFSAPLNFNNIERIEILRGPQGTLYGRNAFSGVVNVITKKPANKTSGSATVDVGNYGQQRYSAAFNTPLVKNKLFLNAGVQLNQRGAVYQNPTLNTKDFDGRKSFNANISLKYLLSDRWTIDFNARTENNTDKGAYPWVATDSIARNAPYKAFGTWANTEKRTNTNAAIAIKHFGKKFNFTAITATIDYHLWYPDRYDFDFTADRFFSGNGDSKQNQVTQEVRFSSPANAGKFKWTVGSFLFVEKTKNSNKTFYEEDFALFDPTAPYITITNGGRNNKGLAFFGQATYAVSPLFDIIVGARYDAEKRELTQNTAFEKSGVVTPLTADSTFTKNFNAFTPKVILNYKVNEFLTLYASYAKGFRIGGFNFNNIADRTYKPEKSDNYEIGLKNSLLNNKLTVNLTAFYFQQKDQQVSTTKNGIDYAILNVGNMNNLGFEAEVSAIPVKNLQVDWTASTSQSKYKKLELFDAATFAVKNYIGNKAIYNPSFQSMLAVQYGVPLSTSAQNFKAFVRGEYRYLGEYQLNFENTESQKGYGLVNARVGVTSNHIDLALWVRNINDVRYMAWGTYASYLLGSPRMLGVTLTAKF